MSLGLGIVLALAGLVTEGILGSRGTRRVQLARKKKKELHKSEDTTYRVPMEALESLATSLLASLEAPLVACWTVSET